jgi:hypothetical protein
VSPRAPAPRNAARDPDSSAKAAATRIPVTPRSTARTGRASPGPTRDSSKTRAGCRRHPERVVSNQPPIAVAPRGRRIQRDYGSPTVRIAVVRAVAAFWLPASFG